MTNHFSTITSSIKGIVAAFMFLLSISDSLQATENRPQALSGKWMIVNFWAQWCKPCREEIPELNRLAVMLGSEDIEVLGINYDGIEDSELDSALKSLDIRFPQMDAHQQALFSFTMPAALPATYIIDPTGEVKTRLIGKQTIESILTAIKHVNPQFVGSDLIGNELMVLP